MADYDLAICMPYYERIGRLMKTLDSFKRCGYFDEGYPIRTVISVCDDGSIREPLSEGVFEGMPHVLSFLPKKEEWLNPCVPLNLAVRQTTSPIILLQSPETYHPSPVLHKMALRLERPYDVVLGCVRVSGHGKKEWYAHPLHRPVKYWFCQMMSRMFYEDINGLSEDYRGGQGYDDDDFARRIERGGGRFKWADDCVVVHVKEPKNYRMPPIRINKRRFESRGK